MIHIHRHGFARCTMRTRQPFKSQGVRHLDFFGYQVPGGYGDSADFHVCVEHGGRALAVAGRDDHGQEKPARTHNATNA